MPPLLLYRYLNGIEVENLRFSPFLSEFFILSPFPRSVYPCTPLARHPTISPLNPFAPGGVLIKNPLKLLILVQFSLFCLDFVGFLMRHPHRVDFKLGIFAILDFLVIFSEFCKLLFGKSSVEYYKLIEVGLHVTGIMSYVIVDH